MRARRGRVCAVAMAIALSAAGCGSGDPEQQVQRAEAQVALKQQALSDARSAFEEASSAFCGSSRSYVVALDRYGDILHSTAPTVGDVRDAGTDLAAPGGEALAAAETAVDAHQEVADAEQDLADAKAALKRAKNGQKATTSNATAESEPSASPLAPASTVNQVEAAEADLDAAVNAVTDSTPLAQATREFNAAAVALEVSWMGLVVDAGCLTPEEEQQAQAAVHDYTKRLQQSLEQAGYYDGPVDGAYGPATVEAVESVQREHDLPVTGAVDKATQAALQSDLSKAGGAAAQEAVASTAAVQQTLKLAGYWDGPVDGEWTPELTEALTRFQKELGVKQTGAVDAATLGALEEAIAAAGQVLADIRDAVPSPEPSPSAASSTTGSPSTSPSDGTG